MQGIFINTDRPRSKKAVREAVAADPSVVYLEGTSVFGRDYDGPVADAPNGEYVFVGPDPHTDRRFYGTITVSPRGARVS